MTEPAVRRVALVKSAGRADAFARAVSSAGFTPVLVSPFRVETIHRGLARCGEILAAGAVDWAVFTSPTAVAQLENGPVGLPELLRRVPEVAAVGPGTASALHVVGITPTVVGTGGGIALADAVLRRVGSESVRLLHLAAEEVRPEFEERMAAADHVVDAVPVYRAVPDAVGERAALSGSFAAVVLASPRLAQRAAELFPDRPPSIAIGRTTAAALRDLGWPPARIAAGPTPAEVTAALVDALT